MSKKAIEMSVFEQIKSGLEDMVAYAKGELTLVTIGANTTATAERDVDLRQTDADTAEQRRFTCGQAVYQGTNGAITLTQDPKWEAGEREPNAGHLQRVRAFLGTD